MLWPHLGKPFSPALFLGFRSERLLVEYENALVLVTDMKIENVKDIIPLLEQVRSIAEASAWRGQEGRQAPPPKNLCACRSQPGL